MWGFSLNFSLLDLLFRQLDDKFIYLFPPICEKGRKNQGESCCNICKYIDLMLFIFFLLGCTI